MQITHPVAFYVQTLTKQRTRHLAELSSRLERQQQLRKVELEMDIQKQLMVSF